jgi:cytochrome P450
MLTASLAPLDETITIAELTRDPYPIYGRLRREAPVLRVKSVGRTFLTKAADTKYVKDNAALFSSDDPNTPMKRAFLAHTLMRKDHDEHRTERMAMMPALMPKTIESVWAPLYAKLAATYLDRLRRGEVVDLFPLSQDRLPRGFWRMRWVFRTRAMRTVAQAKTSGCLTFFGPHRFVEFPLRARNGRSRVSS